MACHSAATTFARHACPSRAPSLRNTLSACSRQRRGLQQSCKISTKAGCGVLSHVASVSHVLSRKAQPTSLASTTRHLSTSSGLRRRQDVEASSAAPKQETTASDLDRLDVLGAVPVPSHSVELCMADGFQLNSGAEIRGGTGVLLVGGEGFAWRPWLARDGSKRLVNGKGQWDIAEESLALLGLVWPRPDILILGLGPEIRPLSPAVRRHVASLGMRVDVMDTHNAAAQFNLLVRERGIDEIAAALIPLGWKEGRGAGP
ncbi:uncharacterized protein B0I36DRAFT_315429 [Microdochium trichocladiopsis]|uniref:NADH dehydrogenase [ubiquinone] 1 alpha subcomplex assembly factor 3 n=1 Tax=Microdochium trichocladiopsis TaxID=1682393 RepID=A0A9P8YH66_9PEZI|nr:uncharacterized protein B0I36DRAFT_315429 [Microdochium trichocladiopsis]KAH7038070.1 hypothetical protein B0I36DRAFT_315429 [Microdochium trichocladiopsis]